MSLFRKILLSLVILLIVIQLIRPGRNVVRQDSINDITRVINVPDSVHSILKRSCYDCHSNNTRYPWYSNIQPVGWILARHIKDGKKELNFDEYANYPQRLQSSKLTEIAEAIREGIMPLPSYRIMHKEARLPEQQKAALIKWAETPVNTNPVKGQEFTETGKTVQARLLVK